MSASDEILLLLPGFDLRSLGEFSAALTDEGTPGLPVSLSAGTVSSAAGPEVSVAALEGLVRPMARVSVFAGQASSPDLTRRTNHALKGLVTKGCRLWGIGAGTLVLARAGCLSGTRVAINPDFEPSLARIDRNIRAEDRPFVWNRDICTARAAGAAALLRYDTGMRDYSAKRAKTSGPRSASEREADMARAQMSPLQERYAMASGPVLQALRIMRANLFQPVSIASLTQALGRSQRQIERQFERDLGASPAQVYREMRMEAARIEVRCGRRPIQEIAQDFGMTKGSFSKTFAKQFGRNPTEDRREAIERDED